MPKLENYHQFTGLHWETGPYQNYWAYTGAKAPHTGQPYSEALMLGVSGGVVMGYFFFDYAGFDPQVRILTRNTFDPVPTMLSRLGVVQHIVQTTQAAKAEAKLIEALEEGLPPLVWADSVSLPYNALPPEMGWWMRPVLVYGYEREADTVWLADRSHQPITISAETLATARARVKKDKFRLKTVEAPDPRKLATAVQQGIWDCIKLFTEKPPKGAAHNFGFAAFDHWAELLVKPKARQSWEKELPPGSRLYSGLKWAFGDVMTFNFDKADRPLYADFLEEASLILKRPALKEVAGHFRESGEAWAALGVALLPDSVPVFKETRTLSLKRRELFREQGQGAAEAIQKIDTRLKEIRAEVSEAFPFNNEEVKSLRENIRDQVLKIKELEQTAVMALQTAMR